MSSGFDGPLIMSARKQPERAFRVYLEKVMGNRWDVQGHEDIYVSGIPDLSYGAKKVNGWIELKHIPTWGAREKGWAKPRHFTDLQVNWLLSRGRAGGRCFVMVKVDSDIFILGAERALDVKNGMNKQTYIENSIKHWPGPVDPDELLGILTT